MARLSKSKAFAIYEDNVVQATAGDEPALNETAGEEDNHEDTELEGSIDAASVIHHTIQEDGIPEGDETRDDEDADDERRESTLTSTTVSSFPDSYYMTENEDLFRSYQSYTPPVIRPRFRRPESIRRMQMTSPPPYGYRSPRQSILANSRSRTGTPRSVRSVNVRESPTRKIKGRDEDEEVEKNYPLVLLHVSVLPLDAHWSNQSMRDLLPPKVVENIQLLKSKLSDNVLQRGVLIPHPRHEYELLEERLLEALELREERLTKCGHFQGRASNSDNEAQSDSGIGSSSDSSDEELCAICQKHIQPSQFGAKSADKTWAIKIYAANGLMNAAAWVAAWQDMERVDVEIMPWISNEIRQKLDERRVEEDAEQVRRAQEQESRIREIVDEQIQLIFQERMAALVPLDQQISEESDDRPVIAESMRLEPPEQDLQIESVQPAGQTDLPQIYRPSQIPISILLKNYLYLLVQDRRSSAIICLSLFVLVFVMAFTNATNNADMAPSEGPKAMENQLSSSLSWHTDIQARPSAMLASNADEKDLGMSTWSSPAETQDSHAEQLAVPDPMPDESSPRAEPGSGDTNIHPE